MGDERETVKRLLLRAPCDGGDPSPFDAEAFHALLRELDGLRVRVARSFALGDHTGREHYSRAIYDRLPSLWRTRDGGWSERREDAVEWSAADLELLGSMCKTGKRPPSLRNAPGTIGVGAYGRVSRMRALEGPDRTLRLELEARAAPRGDARCLAVKQQCGKLSMRRRMLPLREVLLGR